MSLASFTIITTASIVPTDVPNLFMFKLTQQHHPLILGALYITIFKIKLEILLFSNLSFSYRKKNKARRMGNDLRTYTA